MPSTLFTKPPGWEWYIVLYFFFGGLAAGSYVIAALIDLFGNEEDSALARIGYYIAFPALLLCPIFLILDLTRPERFWHLLLESHSGLPIFKYWSAMSVGSWALLIFGAFSFLSFIGSLVQDKRIRWRPAIALNDLIHRGRLRGLFALAGSAFGFFIASYTGVLLSETNRPIWGDSSLIGMLFLTSAASTAAAALILAGARRSAPDSLHRLVRMDNWVMLLELVVLIAFALSLAAIWPFLPIAWTIGLLVVALLGILLPLLIHWRPGTVSYTVLTVGSLFALVGGFLLRAVVVLVSETITRGPLLGLILMVGLALSLSACGPEAARTRGGGAGADVRNWGNPVQMHGATPPDQGMFYQTPLKEANH